ncbi:DedA family protein [Streptomyces sp. uw30]|uniref:DedA family protein n=1 Tax=Streptomyces sp. uw30 TaxID=1828179 RepID=UPI0011CDB3FC|nr:DedA family protein [Streptomyces sp. uw30]TXS43257.1 DedA family protein [Streptomyces sp. uw30]
MTFAHPAAAPVHLAVNLLDAQSLLAAFGTLGIAVILFAETGLLVGFFLPGDSLVFTAGLLCASPAGHPGRLSLPWVLVAAAAGALAGAQTGYLLGRKAGPAFLARTKSRKVRDGADRAADILHRYGHAKAIVLARFLPIVRTVLNPLAGVLAVPARTFTLWQILGGLVWTVGLVLSGYGLGTSVPNVDRYLLPIIAVIVAVSLVPVGLELLRSRRARQARDRFAPRPGTEPSPRAPRRRG